MDKEWKHHVWQFKITAHRTGWPGVWDALKSAITRKPRRTADHPYTVSAFIKYPTGVCDMTVIPCRE